MGRLLRALAMSVAALSLSACNIEISRLGQGSVRADGAEIESCGDAKQCVKADYNQLVELTAEAGPGYQFAGWSGACSGTGRCLVRSLSDQKVVASFKTSDALVPLMDYSDAYYLSGPWPSDLKRKTNGRLDLAGFPFDSGSFYGGIKAMAGKRQGFARNGGIYFPTATNSDAVYDDLVMTFDGGTDALIQLINLEPDSDHYLQSLPVQVRFHRDEVLERDSLLEIMPQGGYSLEPGTRYAVILFEDTYANLMYFPLIQGDAMKHIVATGGTGIIAQHWEWVRNYLTQHTRFEPEAVAAFSVFTTQAESSGTALVKSFLQQQTFQQELENMRYQGRLNALCLDPEASHDGAELHELIITLPNIVKGKPPYIVGGGKLNINADNKLESFGAGTDTKILISIPCDSSPPKEGYPTEIFAMGTATTLQGFEAAGLIDSENHGTLKVYLAAPYTSDRTYDGGLANIEYLEPILGLTSEDLFPLLGDFNPLNLNAIQPQYLQYALDMVVTLEVVKQLQGFVREGYIPELVHMSENLKVDTANISFAGYSLGALAALHANELTDANKNLMLISMPRINTEHFNNVLEFLERNYLGSGGMAALQALLGFDYPMRISDPQLNAMQTAIDELDPVNFLDGMSQTNLLLVMREYEDSLHGRPPSYNFARAVDLRFGIQPVIEYPADSAYPFAQYLDTEAVSFGTELQATPMRVMAAEYDAGVLVNTFTRQMKSGSLPTSVGYYGY